MAADSAASTGLLTLVVASVGAILSALALRHSQRAELRQLRLPAYLEFFDAAARYYRRAQWDDQYRSAGLLDLGDSLDELWRLSRKIELVGSKWVDRSARHVWNALRAYRDTLGQSPGPEVEAGHVMVDDAFTWFRCETRLAMYGRKRITFVSDYPFRGHVAEHVPYRELISMRRRLEENVEGGYFAYKGPWRDPEGRPMGARKVHTPRRSRRAAPPST